MACGHRHSTLVYGWQTSYKAGLFATYAGYSVSYVLSIPINEALVVAGANAEIAVRLHAFCRCL